MQRHSESALAVFGIIRHEDNFLHWLRFGFRMREQDYGTIGIAHETTRDVSKKRAQNDFLFQRAGDDQIDMVGTCGAQNCRGGLTRLVENGRVRRQLQLRQNVGKFFRLFRIALASVDQAQRRTEPVTNAFRFREHLDKPRRKGAGDGNGSIKGFRHELKALPSCFIVFRQLDGPPTLFD